jgi:ABC-type multidrug transport system fused ATPase/permease subunit
MLKHYLTIAFRNLRKYKSQSVISIVGLAVGFTCFALASLWIRYEMTYDTFHKDADRIYVINVPTTYNPHGRWRNTPHPLAGYLKETFPEIRNAGHIYWGSEKFNKIILDGVEYPVNEGRVDSAFLAIFDIQMLAGSLDFLIPENGEIAITETKAKEIFRDENPLGKTISIESAGEWTIGAVVKGWSKHSNYPFDILTGIKLYDSWGIPYGETLIELAPGTDVQSFKNKLYQHEINREVVVKKISMIALTSMHYEDLAIDREVEFQHIILFAVAGILVILASLFNFFTLFVCRFRIREKEFALRMVTGASGPSLLFLLLVEFFVTLIPAFLLSLAFIQWAVQAFQKLANIHTGLSSIYLESIGYIGMVIVVALLFFILLLLFFQKRSLNASIQKHKNNGFRQASIVFQLVISIVFLFATIVLMKQVYFLHHTDLGFTYKNTASFGSSSYNDLMLEAFEDELKQIPEVVEVMKCFSSLLPINVAQRYQCKEWDDKPSGMEQMEVSILYISKQYADFYGFQLIEGEIPEEDKSGENVLVNESLAKVLGWQHAVGKKIDGHEVKGMIRNIHSSLPTVPVAPVLYHLLSPPPHGYKSILFKYQEGKWDACKSKIKPLLANGQRLHNAEEAYNDFLQSENALLKVLSFVSLVCVAISVFGFFSLISLSCEEKRKEIAIRKINGATMRDILAMYFKTYFSLLIIGAIIAFPIGYYIMKQWIEKYVKQTDISAWIYLSIIFVMAFVIILCVGWRVYKASVENPAEVLKTE